MKLYLKYDINTICKQIVHEQLDRLGLPYSLLNFGELELIDNIPAEKLKQLNQNLTRFGIEIIENHKSILVQKIKDAIVEMVYSDEKLSTAKFSTYLAEKLGHSYGYISTIFSEVTYTSIGNFIILEKTERAKQIIASNELNFSEIAWKLNYSSVAHFSSHFKNATGLTPTAFQRIMNKRRDMADHDQTDTESRTTI